MSRKKKSAVSTADLKEALAQIAAATEAISLPARTRLGLEKEIRGYVEELGDVLRRLDPISEPSFVFDPGNPKLVGRFVALALVAQDRCPLQSIPKTYGSGIYAVYYNGSFEPYRPISSTETPIYVGTASPAIPNARTPFEQGPKLSERVAYHAKNIAKAQTTLDIADFEFRSLVVQSGWEKQAESYLIHLFKPIWNKETRIVGGFGKHGDSAETRKHGRSPWDTLHPARAWAGESTSDQKSVDQIKVELADHFKSYQPYRSVEAILADFFDELQASL
jgi:hypothetical protein